MNISAHAAFQQGQELKRACMDNEKSFENVRISDLEMCPKSAYAQQERRKVECCFNLKMCFDNRRSVQMFEMCILL
jgi:hypothetical protein